MKIYRISYGEPNEGTCYAWCASKREAASDVASIKRAHRNSGVELEVTITPIDFKTDRKSLLNWLNLNFCRDNG